MRKIVAGELLRISGELGFDTEMVFSDLKKDDDTAIRWFCGEVQYEMDRLRANEGIQTTMLREDIGNSVKVSIGVSEHEEKTAIVNYLKSTAEKKCRSMGMVASAYPRDKEGAREMVKEIRSRGLMHPFMRGATLFGRPSDDGKMFEPEVVVELSEWQGMVHISFIQSFEPGKGLASKALREMTELADDMGVTMHLTASPTGKPVGGKPLNKGQLKSWYKRLGFRGKGGDEMIRPPA